MSLNNLQNTQNKKAGKKICIQKGCISAKCYVPGLALTGFQTNRPCLQQVNLTWASASGPIKNPAIDLRSTSRNNRLNSMNSKIKPGVWSRDSGQRIPCFWQMSIDHNTSFQYQKGTPQIEGACLCQPISWSMAPSCATPS